VVPAIEQLVNNMIESLRATATRCACGYKYKIYTSNQERGVTPEIKREVRRRLPSSPSSATSRTNTEWIATISLSAFTSRGVPC
jgi:hypothetical protein